MEGGYAWEILLRRIEQVSYIEPFCCSFFYAVNSADPNAGEGTALGGRFKGRGPVYNAKIWWATALMISITLFVPQFMLYSYETILLRNPLH